MATLASLETEVRYTLGETIASFWSSAEIQTHLKDSIRALQVDLVKDAVKAVFTAQTGTPSSDVSVLSLPSGYLETVSFQVVEEDGDYGFPWIQTDYQTLESVKRSEDGQAMDSTSTRLFAIRWDGAYLYFYPTLESGRAYRHLYIETLDESGTLNVPNPMLELVKFRTIMLAATKKSRDLEMANSYAGLYKERVAAINKRYRDLYDIGGSSVGTIGAVQ